MSGLLLNHNFAKSVLGAGVTDVATSLTLNSGDGAKFPSTGDFLCVIWDTAFASPVSDMTREIIKVTARTTDTLTIVRAQESTTAKAWDTGDHIALVITAGKVNELEEELGFTSSGNLLQNSSFSLWDGVAANAPAGWTISGAGATVTIANGTYGHKKLTLTAGGAATAKLTQTLPYSVPKISDDYAIGAFAYVSSGGSGKLVLGSLEVAVTNTTVALKQGSGSVSAWNFEIEIDATKTITVELPTVTLGKRLPYPMHGASETVGQFELGMPQVGKSATTLANGSSVNFDIDGLARDSTTTVLTVRVTWIGIGTTAYAGILTAVHYKASGGTYKGPFLFATAPTGPTTTDKNAVTDTASKVCLYTGTDNVILKNNLGDAIYYTAELIWG